MKPSPGRRRIIRRLGQGSSQTLSPGAGRPLCGAPQGSFRLLAPPGDYRLVADWASGAGGCRAVDVTVERGRFTHADVSCDTGIR